MPIESNLARGTALADLDALVMAEIERLAPQAQAAPAAPATAPRRSSAAVKPLPGASVEPDLGSGEQASALFDAADDDADSADADADLEGSALLSAEEQAFITRALGFLAQRDNADMILGRIWQALADGNPDGYFRPDDAAAGEASSGAAGAGEAPTDRSR